MTSQYTGGTRPSGQPWAKGKTKPGSREAAAQARKVVLNGLEEGLTVEEACKAAGRGLDFYKRSREAYPEFKEEASAIIARRRGIEKTTPVPDFPEFCEEYLGMRLFSHQLQWFDLLEGREPRDLHPSQTYIPGTQQNIVVNTPPGFAKALALDTEVLTTSGFKTIGSLAIGDQVYGPDGKPTIVTGKSEVFAGKKCYRVTTNRGEAVAASEDHLWTIRRPLGSGRYEDEVVTTAELHRRGGEHKLPFVDPLVCDDAGGLPLDPYLLGVWLGDGHTASGRVTTADPEIEQAFVDAGFRVSCVARSGRTGRAWGIEIHGLYPILAELGVKGGKFVPEGYLIGGYDQRLALLQGLMDTDGTCSATGSAAFTSTNRNIAEGVWHLASSLGLGATIKEGRATLNGVDHGPKWMVTFTPGATPVFRLERKLRRQGSPTSRRGRVHTKITSVEPVASTPTQCIVVDNDSHVFLVGRGLTPTHNSTTITVAYVTWRILRDMNTKVIIVSKKQNFAANFLYAIKAILTSSRYRKLQTAWAPLEGFEKSSAEWSATQIRLRDEESDFEKDPTVQVLGIQGQIYGSRADLIVVDDAVVLDNVNQWEQQLRWIRQEVDSRLYSSSSKVLVVGTRVAPVDLYSALLDENNYDGEQSPWTYLTQPAILEDSEDSEQVVTLWPRSNVPPRTQPGQEVQPDSDGLYPKWDHTALMQRRRKLDAHTWNLVWMQRQVSETSIFHREAVLGCMQRTRNPGLMKAGLPGHRERGMSGLYVVAGLDPAAVNYTAAVALAVDRHTGHRWVLDVHNQSGMTPDAMRRLIYDWTETLGVQEWRVEENAFQKFLTLDREVNQWLAMRGVVLQGHTTGRNKADPELGVAAMASLFRGWEDRGNLISLPTHNTSWGVRALVDQLVTWFPGTKAPSDTVMALWFAELRAREIAGQEGSADFVESSWLSPHQMDTREVIDLYDFEGALSG